jgi:hypothetical protein
MQACGKLSQRGEQALGTPDEPQDRAFRRFAAEPVVELGFDSCKRDHSPGLRSSETLAMLAGVQSAFDTPGGLTSLDPCGPIKAHA